MSSTPEEIQAKNIKIAEEIEKYVRTETYPIGIKFYEKREDLPDEQVIANLTFCQLTTIARRYPNEQMYKMTRKTCICPHGIATLGFGEWDEYFLNGEYDTGVHFATIEGARKALAHIPRIKPGTYYGVIISALKNMTIEPDVYFMALSGAQALRSVEAFIFNEGGGFDLGLCGICGICAYTVAKCMLNKTAALGVPCYGSRRRGGYTDNELSFAVHNDSIDNFLDGLAKTYVTGHSIPVPYLYVQTTGLPPHQKIIEWPDNVIEAPKNYKEHDAAGLPRR